MNLQSRFYLYQVQYASAGKIDINKVENKRFNRMKNNNYNFLTMTFLRKYNKNLQISATDNLPRTSRFF